jgi:GTP-dependent phosphoenolpyruvate carboxykinase
MYTTTVREDPARKWVVTIGGRYLGEVVAADRASALRLARQMARAEGWNVRRVSFTIDVQMTGPEVG